MKRFLIFATACLLPLSLLAQQPTPATPCDCAKGQVAVSQDAADFVTAVAAGFGTRTPLGPYRLVAMVTREHRSELLAGKTDAYKADLTAVLTPNPQRACRIATAAVIGLEMAQAFGAQIPASVIQEAIVLQKQLCSTPALVTPEAQAIPGATKHYATGRKSTPEQDKARHAKYAPRFARLMALWANAANLPANYDCRKVCTPIKDQSSCGSCWDFSGTCIVESANILAGNLTASTSAQLSEQYTLDACDGYNGGCGGDDNTTVLMDAKAGGLPLTSLYGPYQGTSERCHWTTNQGALYKIADWGYVGAQDGVPLVSAIKAAMMQYGPIGCAVAADNSFMNYRPGTVFRDSGSRNIDHDVVLVGWQDDATRPTGGYWIMRNSWGTSWGNAGYMNIDYGANQIGYEAVWNTAVNQPAPPTPPTPPTPPVPPTPPPQPTPSHRTFDLQQKAFHLWESGDPKQQDKVNRAIKAAEDVLNNAG